MQRALMQYRNPKNYDLVYEALVKANRQDLIGHGPKCLIRPTRPKAKPEGKTSGKHQAGKNQTGTKKAGLKQGGMKQPAAAAKHSGKSDEKRNPEKRNVKGSFASGSRNQKAGQKPGKSKKKK